jgi:hypothetical protein
LLCKANAELAAKVLETGRDREFSLWLLLRSLDRTGNARVKLVDLERAVADGALFRWGGKPMDKRRLAKWLRRGEGLFWDTDAAHGKVVYRGLERVCAALGVVPYREPVAVPIEALRTLGTARAHLHAAVLTKDEGCQISRARVTALTGASGETQRRREKASGVTHKRQMSREPWGAERGRELRPGGFVVADKKGRLWEFSRIANVYHTPLVTMARGQVRKVRKAIKRSLDVGEAARDLHPCYFRSGIAAQKSRHKAARYYVDTGREWRGFGLWDAYQVA